MATPLVPCPSSCQLVSPMARVESRQLARLGPRTVPATEVRAVIALPSLGAVIASSRPALAYGISRSVSAVARSQ